jgi:hypothetical protein
MLDTLAAGDRIRCTVKSIPAAASGTKTIARLMRKDPTNAKALRRAQDLRRRRMRSYIRGGREWYVRENPAKVVRVTPGQTWEMPFTFDLAPDLSAVEAHLDIQKA